MTKTKTQVSYWFTERSKRASLYGARRLQGEWMMRPKGSTPLTLNSSLSMVASSSISSSLCEEYAIVVSSVSNRMNGEGRTLGVVGSGAAKASLRKNGSDA